MHTTVLFLESFLRVSTQEENNYRVIYIQDIAILGVSRDKSRLYLNDSILKIELHDLYFSHIFSIAYPFVV